MLKVKIREFSDLDFIFIKKSWSSSWLEKQTFSMPREWMEKAISALQNDLIQRSSIFVLCLDEDPEMIIGYIVAEPLKRQLHWVYVKYSYRRLGFGKQLMDVVFDNFDSAIYVTHWTIACNHLKEKWNLEKL